MHPRGYLMLKFNNFSSSNFQLLNKMLLIIIILISSFSPFILKSQEYGGYTDPKTPGRHSSLNIDSAKIVVIPHGIYAEITTEFWFRSVDLKARTDTLEMYNFFDLPASD